MSGGSWDYAFEDLQSIAYRMCNEDTALRQAFGRHLYLVADALKAVEWVDSMDSITPSDEQAIMRVLCPLPNPIECTASTFQFV